MHVLLANLTNYLFYLPLLNLLIQGTTSVLSCNGFRFYAIIVDDFSKYTWLFLMKCKFDFTDIFFAFKAQVENLFDTRIKVLRTDGGGEYTSSLLSRSLQHYGIIHQFSYPHTPEQNGVAERKHRHIIETRLTLLTHSKVSSKY